MSRKFLNNKKQDQFEYYVKGDMAKLWYSLKGNTLYLNYAFVPQNLRGRGIGGEMMEEVLNYAEENELSVVPVCSFTVRYLDDHPKWHKLLPSND